MRKLTAGNGASAGSMGLMLTLAIAMANGSAAAALLEKKRVLRNPANPLALRVAEKSSSC